MKSTLPQIIHQTWKTQAVPSVFRSWQASWTTHHPGWKYMLWTDQENRSLIAEEYPWFLPVYDAYRFDIQRVDAARYFILHRVGGLYVDLDYEALRDTSHLLAQDRCTFGLEPPEAAERVGRQRIISNAFMASPRADPLLSNLIDQLADAAELRCLGDEQYVLESTGPYFLTRMCDACDTERSPRLLPSRLVSPLMIEEADALRRADVDPEGDSDVAQHARRKMRAAFAVHYHSGTWWRSI